MIPSFNIEKTVSFFTDLLDFRIGRDEKTEYGMREVHIIIPETKTFMFIGQEIS